MATMRNRMATIVFLAFVVGVATVALWAPGASAADFTFKIPVQVSNMDPSITATVVCSVMDANVQAVSAPFPVPLDNATGSFSGTITCEVNTAPKFPPQNALKYLASLNFYKDKAPLMSSALPPILKPGAPFVDTFSFQPIP